ncbi:VanZ family protein [Bacillus sp. SRB3LM]|nr:VanZ family protein [Bacillus sp. SRB3LM]MBG0969954.1 VanZ family protein [Bacillus sp. SRB3LM]MBG0972743.1 VanZ family protein [Bacillus sp. SRB3LM]
MLKTSLVISSISLFFERTQLTGVYGLYYCSYRLFDIDDIILNVSGGIISFYIVSMIAYNKKGSVAKFKKIENGL